MLLTDCDNVANTHEIGCEHSVRRRGPIHRARILTLSNTYIHVIKYVFPFHRTRISTLSITCIHIIKYTFPHHHTRISVPHFVGVFIYAGAINRAPTAANGLPKCANGLAIVQYMCVIMWCLWDIKIGEAQNTFVFLHFSTTHFIRRYLGNCATIWRVACPKKVRCLC